jgi:hypothetical protein
MWTVNVEKSPISRRIRAWTVFCPLSGVLKKMADRVGFEPTVGIISKQNKGSLHFHYSIH